MREEIRAQRQAEINLQKMQEDEQGKESGNKNTVPKPQATPTPTSTQALNKGGAQAKGEIDGVPPHVQERVTREVMQKFEDMIYLDELPLAEDQRYKYLTDSFMNSMFYLNEVAAKNVDASPENLGKAMKFLVLYAKNGNADEIDDSIRMIKKDQPERYEEALRELTEDEVLIITEVVDNLDSEIND